MSSTAAGGEDGQRPEDEQQQAEQRGTQEVRAGLGERSGGRRAGRRRRVGLVGRLGARPVPPVEPPVDGEPTVDEGLVVGAAAHGRAVVPFVACSGQLTLSSDWPVRPRVAWGWRGDPRRWPPSSTRFSTEKAMPPRRAAGEVHPYWRETRKAWASASSVSRPPAAKACAATPVVLAFATPSVLLTLPSARWMAARLSSASPAAVAPPAASSACAANAVASGSLAARRVPDRASEAAVGALLRQQDLDRGVGDALARPEQRDDGERLADGVRVVAVDRDVAEAPLGVLQPLQLLDEVHPLHVRGVLPRHEDAEERLGDRTGVPLLVEAVVAVDLATDQVRLEVRRGRRWPRCRPTRSPRRR